MTAPLYTRFSLRNLSLALFIASCGLLLIDASCRRKIPDIVDPVVQADTLAPKTTNPPTPAVDPVVQADTLAPKIITMHISGIPPENIKIDQVKRLLTVTLPKDISAPKQDNVFLKLTDGATLVRFVSVGVSYCNGTFYNPTNPGILSDNFIPNSQTIAVTDGVKNKVYRLKIVPEGEMAFAEPTKILRCKTGSICDDLDNIAIYNQLDSLGYHNSVVAIKNKQTGEEVRANMFGCNGFGKASINSNLSLNLPPGEYSVKLYNASGRQTTNTLTLVMTAGEFQYYGLEHTLSKSQSLTLNGSNLFAGKSAALELWHIRTGDKYLVDSKFNYTPSGSLPKVPTPTGLKSGYYYSRLTYDGKPSAIRYAVIAKDEKQPVLWGLIAGAEMNNITKIEAKEISLKRGQLYGCGTSPTGAVWKGNTFELHLQHTIDELLSYSVPINIPASLGSQPAWRLNDFPSFVIPMTVRPGTYMYRIQYTDKEGVKQLGDWLERDVEIQ